MSNQEALLHVVNGQEPHYFIPGRSVDDAEDAPGDPRWCNVCGEALAAASSPSRPAPADAEQVIEKALRVSVKEVPTTTMHASYIVAALSAAGYVIVRHDQGPSNVHWLDAYSDGAGSA